MSGDRRRSSRCSPGDEVGEVCVDVGWGGVRVSGFPGLSEGCLVDRGGEVGCGVAEEAVDESHLRLVGDGEAVGQVDDLVRGICGVD